MVPTTSSPRKKVCLFGFSANPPTGNKGHVGIVQALSDLTEEDSTQVVYDEIRVVPVYSHPFSEKRKVLIDFEHRLKMCEIALGGIDRVTVDDAERILYHEKEKKLQGENNGNNENPSIRVGTADLLLYYQEKEPNTDFTLCLGADTFLDLMGGKWRRVDEIMEATQRRFVVLYRETEYSSSDVDNPQSQQLENAADKLEETYGKGSVRLLRVPTLGAVSSGLVRSLSSELSLPSLTVATSSLVGRGTNETEDKLREMVNDKVLQYMKENNLYGIGEAAVSN